MNYKEAATFWSSKTELGEYMNQDALYEEIMKFLKAHSTCALATGNNDKIRCTPLTYTIHDGYFDIFSEGGEKFELLEHNQNVSLTVYDPYKGPGTAKSVQVIGKALVLGADDADYETILRSIGMDKLLEKNLNLYLIRINPIEMIYLNGSYKEKGLAIRQVYIKQ